MSAPNPPFRTETRRYGEAAIAEAAKLILEGLSVAVPTETVYGLAADATSDAAVGRIYEAKGRPGFNPLIVHVLDLEQANAIAEIPDAALDLVAIHWPGPLTIVVPRRSNSPISQTATAGLPTVAVRCPAHRAMRGLLAACGRPLAAPSANASGGISPTTAEHVLKSLSGRIPLILDDGPTDLGLESTILGFTPEGKLRLLRPGPIALPETQQVTAAATVEAPGQLQSHYAPSKPLRLNVTVPADDEWMIGFGPIAGNDTLSALGDLTEAASRLFDALHRAEAQPKPRIAVAPVDENGLGAAINDRLSRAAAPRP